MRSTMRVFAVGWVSVEVVASVVGCGSVVEHVAGSGGAAGLGIAGAGFGGSGGVAVNTGGTGTGAATRSSGGRSTTSDGGAGGAFTPHIDAGLMPPPPTPPDAAVPTLPIIDGGPHSIAPPCFQVDAPECGVLAEWRPTDPSGLWTLKRAYPISGSDGFASLVARSDAPGADYLVTGPAQTGCAAFASPPLPASRHFVSVARAVSRGGTLAILARYEEDGPWNGFTNTALFVNGKEWIDPTPASFLQIADVDVDDAGKVFVASADSAYNVDGGVGNFVVERWLSPSGAIVTERRYYGVSDELVGATILANDDVALAYVSGDSTVGDYVQFQASDFTVSGTWSAGLGNSIGVVSARPPMLAVGGFSGALELWMAVLDADDHSVLWQRTRSDVSALAAGVEIDSSGTLNVTGAQTGDSSLILHETRTQDPSPAPDFQNPTYAGRPIEPGLRTQSDGSVLWSGAFAGTYCAPQG